MGFLRWVWKREGRKPRVNRSGAVKMELLRTGRAIENGKEQSYFVSKGGQKKTLNGTGGKGGEKEDKILLAGLEDKIRQLEDRYMITNSSFLDLRQRSLAETMSRSHSGLIYGFYGGYEDAERVIEVFFPEGFMIGENVSQHFRNIPEENPLTVIRAELKKGSPVLSHRDYLGALMGLGIRREMTGDIIVRRDGADIIVMKEIAEFLLLNYMRAGRANLYLSEVSTEEIIYSAGSREKVLESVASLRLDNVVSAAFHVPRSRAAEMIAAGTVFLGGICEKKADRQVREGEKIVLRGKGKTVLKEIGGKSSKGRIMITLEKYV